MTKEKTYQGTIIETRKPEKTVKIVVDTTDKDFEELMFELNKKVKIIIDHALNS